MGLEVALIGGALLASAVAAKVSIDAQHAQAKAQIKQIERQMQEKAEQTQAKKADRAAAADRALASIQVAMAEQGGAGSDNERRMLDEAAYLEGVDIARLEVNRTREIEALTAEGEAVRDNFAAKRTAAMIGFAQSAVSIGSSYYGSSRDAGTVPTGTEQPRTDAAGRIIGPV